MSDTEVQDDEYSHAEIPPVNATVANKTLDLSTKIWEDGKLEKVSQVQQFTNTFIYTH